ncbi:hypothetical protein [Chromobacterium sp. IIBBL 290-4]|uniref:hypothetical protein n=1 Tax=Chromobacterium sp. IIBBL 290-4 TaxID=2953890 RepID=UPI0020B88FBD|nr:hypothetical protein [Chromobacterium sp. IIBBL 290-4]UTH72509.1 hypothetical protein NKT35_13210 [Chromobacterium sp. IIBBL 290-4]
MTPLATTCPAGHNGRALLISAGLGGPNIKADSRLAAIFTSVRTTIGAPSLAGRGWGVLARAGSLMPVRQPFHVPASPLGGEELGLTLIKETYTMSSLILRAIRALPLYAITIATTPTKSEAAALARLLVSQGRRALILPAGAGFSVQEVR